MALYRVSLDILVEGVNTGDIEDTINQLFEEWKGGDYILDWQYATKENPPVFVTAMKEGEGANLATPFEIGEEGASMFEDWYDANVQEVEQ